MMPTLRVEGLDWTLVKRSVSRRGTYMKAYHLSVPTLFSFFQFISISDNLVQHGTCHGYLLDSSRLGTVNTVIATSSNIVQVLTSHRINSHRRSSIASCLTRSLLIKQLLKPLRQISTNTHHGK